MKDATAGREPTQKLASLFMPYISAPQRYGLKRKQKHLREQLDVFVLHVTQGCTNRRCPGIDFLFFFLHWLQTFWSTVFGICFWLLEFLGGSCILGKFMYTFYNNFSVVKFKFWSLHISPKKIMGSSKCLLSWHVVPATQIIFITC